MARINLLDWREELRQERQKEFFITLVIMVLLAALIWFLVHTVMNSRIENQQNRNNYLQTEIRQLDRQIAEIEKLEKQRAALIARMNVIQDLQLSRPEVVRMFDELVRVVPEGINLNNMQRKDQSLVFVGEGESNPRISEFMRKMNSSDRLETGDLRQVEKQNKGLPSQIFTLDAVQVIPNQAGTEAGQQGEGN